jgi:hypothetical protein
MPGYRWEIVDHGEHSGWWILKMASKKRRSRLWNKVVIPVFLSLLPMSYSRSASGTQMSNDNFFILENGENLCELGGHDTEKLLTLVYGRGEAFDETEKRRYCELKNGHDSIQWVLMNLESGRIISRSKNAGDKYFGASVSKLFVAATLLDKQHGKLSKSQLRLMVEMIVKSSNSAWIELQRQAGDDGTDDSGRLAVQAFTQHMGYAKTRGFQGWRTRKDGSRIHGNELNTMELSRFLYDTYHRKYKGAEVLWKIMYATKTGNNKVNKYTPGLLCIGGKTGTYHGENASPETVKLKTIKAHNHVVVFKVNGVQYGLSILSNTGSDEDVAILGGGIMREFLDLGEPFSCKAF